MEGRERGRSLEERAAIGVRRGREKRAATEDSAVAPRVEAMALPRAVVRGWVGDNEMDNGIGRKTGECHKG